MDGSGLFAAQGTRVALKAVHVEATLLSGYTHVTVTQRYRNDERTPVEAIYTFPLPADATLVGFAMETAGRRSEGVVQEREKAFRTYDDAVLSGHGAALLEQERANVFTATVGNVLPGETTNVEVRYVQRVHADEGSLRWMLPTLVAPRYIPGEAAHAKDRTGHGTEAPTTRVPDADRISPPIGDARYGLTLKLTVDLGRELEVESPSHAVHVERDDDRRSVVTFASEHVALDRDVVVLVRGAGAGMLSSVRCHRAGSEEGSFALTLVPDLLADLSVEPQRAGQDVVFAIDTSGSMEGDSIVQARAALRLCLRHLREGDRFNVIAFSTSMACFAERPVAFTRRSLEDADRWVAQLHASGGTEMLEPMETAARMAAHGVVVLLTDGQVGNEAEILRAVLSARSSTRVYSFGIGTNVSDALLRDLGQRTGGAVEFIHPGERIDDKVVAVFARAIAPRVSDVTVEFTGVDAGELAPGKHADLVDGEVWTLFGRYSEPGSGRAVVRGRLNGAAFVHEVPVHLLARVSNPSLPALWASARIRDLEAIEVTGRRADAMRARVIELATTYAVNSSYTSFVVIEKRTGARRAQGETGVPEARVVPVNAPAGWGMAHGSRNEDGALRKRKLADPYAPVMQRGGSAGGPARSTMVGMAPAGPVFGGAPPAPPPAPMAPSAAMSPSPRRPAPEPVQAESLARKSMSDTFFSARDAEDDDAPMKEYEESAKGKGEEAKAEKSASEHTLGALIARQGAEGLWDDTALPGAGKVREIRATVRALLEAMRAGVDTSHARFGTPLRKAVEAITRHATALVGTDDALAGLALALAWWVSTGPRSRNAVVAALRSHTALTRFADAVSDRAAMQRAIDEGAQALGL